MSTRVVPEHLGALPVWAGSLVEHLMEIGEPNAPLYTATSHERIMARLSDGTIWIANRGRGMTTLTASEATDLATFLLGPSAQVDGTEWGVRTGERVVGFGLSDAAEDAAYRTAEAYDAKGVEADVVRRDRLTVATAWESV